MMETKPKILQLQRFSHYSKVADVCRRWEEISNRIQVSFKLYTSNFNYTTYVKNYEINIFNVKLHASRKMHKLCDIHFLLLSHAFAL